MDELRIRNKLEINEAGLVVKIEADLDFAKSKLLDAAIEHEKKLSKRNYWRGRVQALQQKIADLKNGRLELAIEEAANETNLEKN